jgi:Thioredoxin like C-terminal domain
VGGHRRALGADIGAQGNGSVAGQRPHQLVRQWGKVDDRAFEIEFPDPGPQAFAITFGRSQARRMRIRGTVCKVGGSCKRSRSATTNGGSDRQ